MLNHFPRYISTRAIYCYLVTLILISTVYLRHVMPFQFMVFGFVPVAIFFVFSTKLTTNWIHYSPRLFTRKLFLTALVLRIVYAVFIYFYYLDVTGEPFAYHAGDEHLYHYIGSLLRPHGIKEFVYYLKVFNVGFSDSGYCWWLALVYTIFGPSILSAHILKCFIDAFACVLIYNLGRRNFGEVTGRMAAIFCMLMPNMWYYCGVTLKETEMAFLTVLFVERADLVFRFPKIKFKNLIMPGVTILVMFTFRTALAAVLVAAFGMALLFSSRRQLKLWQKILYIAVFSGWMFLTVGNEIVQETQELWEGRVENQSVGYEWRAEREGGNSFARYATATVMAPLIFTIPFSTMVDIPKQENQMMMNGANFIKNIMSGLTVFALFTLLFNGEWRKHVLSIAVMLGYLIVLVFSNFAHSERFHFPVLALELMFAAVGVSYLKNKHKRWYMIWLIGVCVANLIWAWVKLRGRGMA